jgi:CBS domain-containing protein
MLVRDVMTETVVVADPAVTVREIAKLMRDHSVGSVVLVEHERPVGFITDRDLAMSVVADGRDSFDPVSEHASTPVITADPDMEIDEGAQLCVTACAGWSWSRPGSWSASSRSTTSPRE